MLYKCATIRSTRHNKEVKHVTFLEEKFTDLFNGVLMDGGVITER